MKKRDRPSWDEYFVTIVTDTAKRASCLRREVGAILVKDKRILTTGYNGAPIGIESCFDKDSCWRREHDIPHGSDKDLCKGVHAEANAIYQAARKGISVEGSTLYVTTFPCPTCAKGVVQSGIVQVNYVNEYDETKYASFSRELLEEAGVKIRKLESNL